MRWLRRYIERIPNKTMAGIMSALLLVLMGISAYFIYTLTLFKDIENLLRYGIMIATIIILVLMILYNLNAMLKRKWINYIIFILVLLIIGSAEIFLIFNVNKIFSSMENINREYVTYSTSLVTLKDAPINNINEVKNKKIGIINDKNSIEGYIISQDIIKEQKLDTNNELVEYEDFIYMLNDLYDGKLDAIFLSTNYDIIFGNIEHYANITSETKIIITKEKKMEKQQIINKADGKKITEPFTILLMGVDSPHETLDKNAAVNGDALILITFNPTTLNATILSIPRDTYVPITCFRGQIENKITHAAWYGESCMINTIEKFTGIDIDYYVKINFKGVVKLVDALGGVTIDVPVSFCEQDSNRQWGKKKICLKEGLQTLNGEQALALTRHRKTFIDGDLRRAQHQQLVMRGIINELKDINSLNTIYKILDAISKNIDTNLTKNQILEFYNVGKDVLAKSKASSDFVTMQQLHLDGWGQTIYDEGIGLPLWNYMYYRASLKEVVEAMEINLKIKQPTLIKEFSYSINKSYTPKVIGDGHYKKDYIIHTLPDFTKNSRTYAENWGIQNNIKMTFITIDKDSPEYKDEYVNGQIIYQSVPAYYRVAKINKEKGITLKIVKKVIEPEKINCSLEENYNNPLCLLPDFTGWTIAQFNNWVTNAPGSFLTNTIEITIDDPDYDLSKAGQIFWQSEAVGTKIIDLVELEVKYYAEAEEIGEDGETGGSEEEPPGDEDTEEG